MIEADFDAVEIIRALRSEVKQLPSIWVAKQNKPARHDEAVRTSWNKLTSLIAQIASSNAAHEIDPSVLDAVLLAFNRATEEYRHTERVLAASSTDLNGLMERAIFTDSALASLVDALDAPARAVRMALEMRVRVGELSRTWRKHGHELGFGVGIAQGYATLGRIGFEGRFDYAAIGPVSNLASRLCDEAGDGDILISQRALAAVEELVEAQHMGELALKASSDP